jgi:hypothetical protein
MFYLCQNFKIKNMAQEKIEKPRIWTTTDKTKDRIIAFANNTLYHGNPKSELVEDYVQRINNNDVPNDLFGVPASYMKQVHLNESKKYIEVIFGVEGTEHFRVEDDVKKKEIFDFMKEKFDTFDYSTEKASQIGAMKPVIAFLVALVAYFYIVSIAADIESGAQYEIRGNAHSSGGIVLLLASLGVKTVSFIFGVLIIAAIRSVIKKSNDTSIVHKLVLKKG